MKYNQLGQTGIQISRLGFGALHISSAVGSKQLRRMVELCVDAGVNYIDTAHVYGDSEAMLGRALRGLRDKFHLSSKAISRDVETFEQDFNTSFRRLGCDYIDLYYIHDVSTEHEYEQVMTEGVYDFCVRAREEERIGHVCMSTHSIDIAEKIIRSGKFAAVMLAYNPQEREIETGILPLARENGVGVVAMKPFGGGVLCGERGTEYGVEVGADELLSFVFNNDMIDTVIPGVDTEAYMQEAIAAERAPAALDEAAVADLVERTKISGVEFCRGCGYCQPCEVDIPIRDVMQAYTKRKAYQGVNWQKMFALNTELETHREAADTCIECGNCVDRCPYSLPIMDVMKSVAGASA